MKRVADRQLDPSRRSKDVEDFESALRHLVIGQDQAVDAVVNLFQTFKAGLNPPNRPVGNLLFLGPTGTGKTVTIEKTVETLFGDVLALLKVDCAEFQHSHEISKLIGCFVPGTGVLMADGTSKAIEEVQVGDEVVTKDGTTHPVTFLHRYEHDGEMVELRISNSNIPVVCTPQHEIWAIRSPWRGRGRATTKAGRALAGRYDPEKLEYVTANELRKGDIVVYPRQKLKPVEMVIDLVDYTSKIESHERYQIQFDATHVWLKPTYKTPRFIKVDVDFCRLAGYYVSEGGCHQERQLHFTFGGHEGDAPCIKETKQLLKTIFGDEITVGEEDRTGSTNKEGSAVRIRFASKIICLMMTDLFGDHVLRKKIPSWFFQLEPKLLWEFLDTAFLGDGGKSVRRRLDYSTSSPYLASQMRHMIHNLGFTTQIQKHHPIDPRGFKAAPRYRLYVAGAQIERFVNNLPEISKRVNLINPGNAGIQRMSHVDTDYVYFRLTDVNRIQYKGQVCDFSVEEKTSYVVDSIAVSNSPPGYLGHKETHPVLTQEAINQYQTENLRMTFILFDEIEKASDSLWQLLLGILDKGTLTLGDNRRIDMSSCVIVMTSNVGATEMSSLVNGGMGFVTSKKIDSNFDAKIDAKIQSTAVQAARRKFSPEFMNRIDKTVVFNTLRQEHLEQILELELEAIQLRILRAQSNGQFNKQFIFECNEEVKKHLLHEGTDPQYGARHLKRVIERALVSPLSNLIATGQINTGDLIRVSLDKENEFHFTVETENLMVPIILEKFSGRLTTANRISPPAIQKEEPTAVRLARKKLKEAEDQAEQARELRNVLKPR